MKLNKKELAIYFFGFSLFVFIAFFYGAVPFLSSPTLLQALWTTGYAQSIANSPNLFEIYASNIGYPTPAAIAFGLSGALPTAYFIRMGLEPVNAYALMVLLWLFIAYYFSYKLCNYYRVNKTLAWFLSMLWLSMPIIWAHSGYSMLYLGIALLPCYYYMSICFLNTKKKTSAESIAISLSYLLTCIISAFMDGYTFLMFACMSSLILLGKLISNKCIIYKVLIHCASFATAFFLYSSFINKTSYTPDSLDFFRGWGLDVSFILIPSQGMSWLLDKLGLSIERNDSLYFGDDSVWQTTFCIPIVIMAIGAWFYIKKKNAKIVLIMGVLAFYLSLGPSLKFNTKKPVELELTQPHQLSSSMPENYGIMETGSAWISSNLPGFNNMRAAYRWSALGIFSCWLLFVMFASAHKKNHKRIIWTLSIIIISLNLPNLKKVWQDKVSLRKSFIQIQNELVESLRQYLSEGQKVIFLPTGNDFLITFASPLLKINSFNIGGDKNLASAQNNWSPAMLSYSTSDDITRKKIISLLLLNKTTDVVILPYFDTLNAGINWPCHSFSTVDKNGSEKKIFKSTAIVKCPIDYRSDAASFISLLRENQELDIQDEPLFAVIKLKNTDNKTRLEEINNTYANIKYPIALSNNNPERVFILSDGWYDSEVSGTWSKSNAELKLPIPHECKLISCKAILNFGLLAPNAQHPITVRISAKQSHISWSTSLTATTEKRYILSIPLLSYGENFENFKMTVDNASSPASLNMSPDHRTLGIYLQNIDLEK